MKTMRYMILVLAAAAWTGCSKVAVEEQAADLQEAEAGAVQFTATLGPKGAVTKTLNDDGTTAWAKEEVIAVYYQTSGGYDTVSASVTAVDGEGNATIEATLSADAMDGGTVNLVYPETLHDGAGGIRESALLNQNGTIAGISTGFDAVTGAGTLAVSDGNASINGFVHMTNQLLIGKFTPMYGGSAISGITKLTVNDGTRTYTATGTFGTDGIYVAMLPVAEKEVILIAETASQTYGFGGKVVTLEQGKFYTNLAIPMLKAYDLSIASVSVTSENVFIYQSNAAATANTVTVGDAYTAVLSNLNIAAENNSGVICSNNMTLTLSGSNTVEVSEGYHPAIMARESLIIQGPGIMSATGGDQGAGIGSGRQDICGDITISGGTVIATGGDYAAGIGSGSYNSSCGSITITGGTVTATGGNNGPGIGSGYQGSCGNITITGGTVTATGGYCSTGIGSVSSYSYCGDITITGGTVEATGKDNASGIGGVTDTNAFFGSIRIEDSITRVTATRGSDALRSLGYGNGEDPGYISIDENINPSPGDCGDLRIEVTKTIVDNDTWIIMPK